MIHLDCADRPSRARSITSAAAAIKRGEVVLVPTEACYALATDAFGIRGAQAVRELKGIGTQVPLPVMVPSATTVAGLTPRVPAAAQDLMTAFWPGGLTLLLAAQSTLAWDHPAGAPVAVRMPLHPVLLSLLQAVGPMVVTAANGRGMDPPPSVAEAVEQLGDSMAFALDAGPLADGEPSTVVDLTGPVPRVLRAGAVSIDDLRTVCPAVEAAEPSSG